MLMKRILPIVVGLCLASLPFATAHATYADLDDQSGGIAAGFGAWGPWASIQEPELEVPGKGIITVYHPDQAPAEHPTIFFISGWGRTAESYQEFFHFLVSHEYTVVNIYNYNPGTIETSYPNALDMIEKSALDYSTWIDTAEVGLMGHSYGGGAAIWLGQRVFGDWNWGVDGKRFILTTAPWLTFLTTRADLESYPADTKLQIQISYDDVASNQDYVWNTDPRAIRAVFELINIPDDEKDFVTVYSDPVRSYEYNGDTYTYDADHYLSYTGSWGGHYEPYDELDVYVLNRLAHAMVEYVFEENPAAKIVALGNGSPDQIQMGLLPDLMVTDYPVVTRDQASFAYRCGETASGTWGDPDIWMLQDFCDDADGDGLIDALEPAAGSENFGLPQPIRITGIQPNPFNPRTLIRFQLTEPSQVTLRIYNLGGELVRTLVDSHLPAGSQETFWNGRDDQGMALASGCYVAKLASGTVVSTQSMVLIR